MGTQPGDTNTPCSSVFTFKPPSRSNSDISVVEAAAARVQPRESMPGVAKLIQPMELATSVEPRVENLTPPVAVAAMPTTVPSTDQAQDIDPGLDTMAPAAIGCPMAEVRTAMPVAPPAAAAGLVADGALKPEPQASCLTREKPGHVVKAPMRGRRESSVKSYVARARECCSRWRRERREEKAKQLSGTSTS